MSAETSLYSNLSAYPSLTALVGQRIYPDEVPNGVALPCVTYTRVDTEYVQSLSGEIAAKKAVLEIICLAPTRASSEQVGDSVLAACLSGSNVPSSRRSLYDSESEIWATNLTVDIWE